MWSRDLDRYVMLSPKLLEILREWWKVNRPRHWLFSGDRPGQPITRSAVEHECQEAHRRCRIPKPITPHSLRHAFAVHLLEAGTGVRTSTATRASQSRHDRAVSAASPPRRSARRQVRSTYSHVPFRRLRHRSRLSTSDLGRLVARWHAMGCVSAWILSARPRALPSLSSPVPATSPSRVR
jgi:hypothetical protein